MKISLHKVKKKMISLFLVLRNLNHPPNKKDKQIAPSSHQKFKTNRNNFLINLQGAIINSFSKHKV